MEALHYNIGRSLIQSHVDDHELTIGVVHGKIGDHHIIRAQVTKHGILVHLYGTTEDSLMDLGKKKTPTINTTWSNGYSVGYNV